MRYIFPEVLKTKIFIYVFTVRGVELFLSKVSKKKSKIRQKWGKSGRKGIRGHFT